MGIVHIIGTGNINDMSDGFSKAISLTAHDGIQELVGLLNSSTSTRPIVVVSTWNNAGDPTFGIDPDIIAHLLGHRADVYALVDAAASWRLAELDPSRRTYGGAVRVTGPNNWSRIIRTDCDPLLARKRIETAVTDAEQQFTRQRTRRCELPLLAPVTVSPSDVARRTTGIAHSEPRPDRDETARRRLRGAESELDRAFKDLTDSRNELASEKFRNAELESNVNRLELEVDSLHRQLESLRTKCSTAESTISHIRERLSAARAKSDSAPNTDNDRREILFSDPEQQLRFDIGIAWLRRVDEQDRTTLPLRAFSFGPKFLTRVESVPAPREKVLDVIVDVLTRRAYDMPGRAVHPHGNGRSAGITGKIVRTDGASGYRCYIRNATANAPRLLWWECTDGSVELALAGRHDDPMP